MPGLGAQPFASLLEDVARASPAPGGGSSAACAAALAAALVEMAAGLVGNREAASRSSVLRGQLLELAERELTSYEPVLDALRLPSDDPGRPARLEATLRAASEAPLAIARAGAELAELGVTVAEASSPSVRGDAIAGTLLAEAASTAAALLVELNLERQPSEPALADAGAARARADKAREAAEALRPPGRRPA